MVLVTGGTGLVGSHLLFNLVKAEIPVRAIYRDKGRINQTKKIFGYYSDNPNSLFDKIDWIKSDLNNIPLLQIAFKNITTVYHCAALISFDPKDSEKLFKINLEGTANIINLSIANRIKKLCYVSSIATIGTTTNDKSADETTEFNDSIANIYALSKQEAEMEVWRGSQEGLDVIIVNPGIIIGPGFWNSGSGKIFRKISQGLLFYLPGETGFVSVTDVVKAMVNLMNSDIVNENYILASKNLSYKEAFTTIALALDKKPPKKLLKKWMLAVLWRLDWIQSSITGAERILTKKMALSFGYSTTYSTEKIKEDISFEYEDLEKSISHCGAIFLEENP